MGIAATLFFSTTDPAETLDWRIRPSEEQFEAQQARWNHLAEYLLADLQRRSGHRLSSWLQGSYKFGTQIRPALKDHEFDIDLGVYFGWSGEPEDGDVGASDLKAMVQASLENYAAEAGNESSGVSPPKARCSRIHFDDGFHIDVPAYHLDADRDMRALAAENDSWEDSDPKAIYTWWKDALDDQVRPRGRRVVRYLKMWAALNFETSARPSSILLTVLTAQALGQLDLANSSGDDETLRAVAVQIVDRLGQSTNVRNPANEAENLNRLPEPVCDAFVEKLEEFISIADRALAVSTKAEGAEIWSEAFAHFFPIPSDEEVREELVKSASQAIAVIRFDPIVEVEAKTHGSPPRVFADSNRIGPIPKKCDITFILANASALPAGATVEWIVRNEGEEAEAQNDLGHRRGNGMWAHETSAYRGTHFMDVSVKLNGRLIGRRRVPVTISGLGFPARNPPKPNYIRFRGRR
jgi:hypothetical protein